MMSKMLSLAIMALVLIHSTISIAHPSRVKLILHGNLPITDEIDLSGHFIPAGNLLGEVAPRAFIELNWAVFSYLTISPCVGWTFKPDEAIISLRLSPKVNNFYGWIDFETQPQSWDYYWFAQIEWKAIDWLHLGIEEESWGNFYTFEDSSYGGGPNILLRFQKHIGADLALHVRQLNGEVGPEFFLRFHVFL